MRSVSFIIPAYNEERALAGALIAIRDAVRGLGEPYEIIVADDASTDRTAAIAEAQGARVTRVRNRQISATRNAGARAARGDRFIFVDADTRVNAELVRAALAAMHAGAVGGGCAVRFDEPLPRYARIVERLLVDAFRHAKLAAGCFVFCTREAFETVGGFDETVFGAEEVLISQALKRHGRFVILRERVLTSGRKLRAYSGAEFLRMAAYFISRGRRSVETRERLEMWYGPRREDPEDQDRALSA